MTAKVEVQYKDGTNDIIPVPNLTIERDGDHLWVGETVLINLSEVISLVLHEDVPEPEPEVEEEVTEDVNTTNIYYQDKSDNDRLIEAIERVERAIEKANAPKELFRNPNPYDKHYPYVHWGVGRTGTWPSGGTVTYNVATQDPEKIAEQISKKLHWETRGNTNLSGYFEGSKEAYESAGVEGETNTEPVQTCNCEADPDARCADHPYGYYL